MHAYETHAYQLHAHQMYAYEMHACGVHVYEILDIVVKMIQISIVEEWCYMMIRNNEYL